MPTKHPRLSIVLEPYLFNILVRLAALENISLSLKARDLLRMALEYNEDLYWTSEANEREKTFNRKKALSHTSVWGK
jgi:hypothetical protein